MVSRRQLHQKIRALEEEVSFLRDTLYVASGGKFEPFVIEVRVAEAIGKTDVDSFVKSLLTES